MNSFINIQKEFKPTENFWDLNPHLIYIKPFSLLYNRDKSKNKTDSSKDMWCILWLSDPDEDVNKYYRLPMEDRLDVCKEFNPTFSEEEDVVATCIQEYEEKCLTTIERAYKQEKEKLVKRAEFLRKAEYNFDTMKGLDDAYSKSKKIWDDYARIEKDFFENKNKTTRIFGGRKQTLRERGQIIPDK
jgi:hypothetical protein